MTQENQIIVHTDSPSLPVPAIPPPREGVDEVALNLSPKQILALTALQEGNSYDEAAEAADVDRGTLYRWRKIDPNFIAALNRWRGDLREQTMNQVLVTGANAQRTLNAAIDQGDGRLGLRLLEKLGWVKSGLETPVDPYAIFGAGLDDETKRRTVDDGFQRVSRYMTQEQRHRAAQLLALGVVHENRATGRSNPQDLLDLAGPIPEAPRTVENTTEIHNDVVEIRTTRVQAYSTKESGRGTPSQHRGLASQRVKVHVTYDADDSRPRYRR